MREVSRDGVRAIRPRAVGDSGRRVLALRHRYPATPESLPRARRAVAQRAEELGAGDSIAESIA
ncbi:MAG: hypothetical protein LC749_06935, partial [Actinobacteria bacterium]|nr:hypothetical protein [Actinomycetota bacterium]